MSRRSLQRAKAHSEWQITSKPGEALARIRVPVAQSTFREQKPRKQHKFSIRNPKQKSKQEFQWTMRNDPRGDATRKDRRREFAPGTIGAIMRDVLGG